MEAFHKILRAGFVFVEPRTIREAVKAAVPHGVVPDQCADTFHLPHSHCRVARRGDIREGTLGVGDNRVHIGDVVVNHEQTGAAEGIPQADRRVPGSRQQDVAVLKIPAQRAHIGGVADELLVRSDGIGGHLVLAADGQGAVETNLPHAHSFVIPTRGEETRH